MFRPNFSLLTFVFLVAAIAAGPSSPGPHPPAPGPCSACPAAAAWSVYFSPAGGCTEAVVREIAAAKKTILVQAYNFSSPPIAAALLAAHRRGVDVQVIEDKRASGEKKCQVPVLRKAGIKVLLDGVHPIAHNKVMVIDAATVLTGSFNWSTEAERNAENLLVIRDAALAAKYAANWQAHAAHSK
jgi:phosphatidylserine/phosphatidylglycerophosphate/cardiolipin synthase-like enzyme